MAEEEAFEAEVMDDDASGTISSTALESITRGEIDVQVATAKRFPRNLAKFKTNAITAVTSSQEIAESCNYYLTRKGKDGVKVIEGPSIRLTEICMNFFGNTRWAGRVIGEDERYIYAQGVVHDVENNNFVSEEVPRKITGSNGKRFSADMVAVTGAAAKSIAMRNAALRVIPRSYIEEIRLKAKERAQGKAENVLERWGKAVIFFKNYNVTEAQLLAKVDRESVEKLTPDDIGKLIGLRTSLKEGLTTIAEQFPPVAPAEETPEGGAALETAPAPRVDANTDKVADDLAKKNPPKRSKGAKAEKAVDEQLPADRGELLRILHEKLTSIFETPEQIDAAIKEASKDSFASWDAFGTRATVEQVQEALDAITHFATATKPATEAAGQADLLPPAAQDDKPGAWIARLTQKLPADEERSTWVLRILKGAEILNLSEKQIAKEISTAIDMDVKSADALVGLKPDALKAVHKRMASLA